MWANTHVQTDSLLAGRACLHAGNVFPVVGAVNLDGVPHYTSAGQFFLLFGRFLCTRKSPLEEFDLAVVVGFVFGHMKPFGVVVG